MRAVLVMVGMLGLLSATSRAATPVVVTNGAGIFYSNYAGMGFTDANGNYLFIGGTQGFAEVFYPDGTHGMFPYDPATQTFSGSDAKGTFTAFVHETLMTTRRGGGGGRGDGYPGIRTSVASGVIDYLYDPPPGASPPSPLLQILRVNRTTNSVIASLELALNGDKQGHRDPLNPGAQLRHKYWLEASSDLAHWTRAGGPSATYFAGAVLVPVDTSQGGASGQIYIRSGDAGLFAVP